MVLGCGNSMVLGFGTGMIQYMVRYVTVLYRNGGGAFFFAYEDLEEDF